MKDASELPSIEGDSQTPILTDVSVRFVCADNATHSTDSFSVCMVTQSNHIQSKPRDGYSITHTFSQVLHYRLLDEIIKVKDDIRWRRAELKKLKQSAAASDANVTDLLLEEIARNETALLEMAKEEQAQHRTTAALWSQMRQLKKAHGVA